MSPTTFLSCTQNPLDWEKTWALLQEKWGNIDHCPDGYQKPFNIDAKLNGGYLVIGLLYGDGDWYKTMNYATRCGQDADCNPANAARHSGYPDRCTCHTC